MKKLFIILISILLLASACRAATLNKIIRKETKDRLQLILDISGEAKYSVKKGNSYTVISIPGLQPLPSVPTNIKSKVLDGVKIEDVNGVCEITAQFKYLTSSSITSVKEPHVIVVSFNKLSKMKVPKISVPEMDNIQTRSFPDKFSISVNLTSFVPYTVNTSEGTLTIDLPNTNLIVKNRKMITNDKLIPKIEVLQSGTSSQINISRTYPSFYQIYRLEDPLRLVIEFDRSARSTLAATDEAAGLRYVKMTKGTEDGPVTINALVADQKLLNVYPFLAHKKVEPPNLIGMVGSIFTGWGQEEQTKYVKDRITSMAEETKAIAGVNGTFFGKAGEPLGILMVNGELVSYSIHDRTALIIDKNNRCYIDNVSMSGESLIEGRTIQLSGINRKRITGEAIVYTPKYGSQTDEDAPGIVLSVSNDEVKAISRAHAWIPDHGYVLSLDPNYWDSLGDKIHIGSRIETKMKLIPLSGLSNLDIKHVIGGGPRLLKSGDIYISKNSEQFKTDIAKSRTARTAVGINKEGLLVFATVDKCQESTEHAKSVGVTLEELAQIMKDLGCIEAMNLDGGSSSTMVLNDKVINTPSGGGEKPVSNGILIGK